MTVETNVETPDHIHADGTVALGGVSLDDADRAMILVHGRGATPESILTLADELPNDLGFALVAPGASVRTNHPRSWYPQSFLAPTRANEPGLSSGLRKIEQAVETLGEHGIGPESVILLGFSQGACLATEFAARNARRWGGVVALTGGLIGERDTPRDYGGDYGGDFAGTPIFLGSSDVDPHVPLWRVEESDRVLSGLGAEVETRIYPGMPHTVVRDELDWVEETMRSLAGKLTRR